MIDLRGHGMATVNDKLQLGEVKIFYDVNTFLEVMEGKRPHTDLFPFPAVKAIDNAAALFCPHLTK